MATSQYPAPGSGRIRVRAAILATGNWTAPAKLIAGTVTARLVGGGGSGCAGGTYGGISPGGDGGQVLDIRLLPSEIVPGTVYPVTIGAGGAFSAGHNNNVNQTTGVDGGDTAFAGYTARGGWGGGSYSVWDVQNASSSTTPTFKFGNQNSGHGGRASGGDSPPFPLNFPMRHAQGVNGNPPQSSDTGGRGQGHPSGLGGGGGGGGRGSGASDGTRGSGGRGACGGGDGGLSGRSGVAEAGAAGSDGKANTGGGGGGGGASDGGSVGGNSGAGGSGVLIIEWEEPA